MDIKQKLRELLIPAISKKKEAIKVICQIKTGNKSSDTFLLAKLKIYEQRKYL